MRCQEVMEQDPREGVREPEGVGVKAEAGWEVLDWGWEATASALAAARRCPIREAFPVTA